MRPSRGPEDPMNLQKIYTALSSDEEIAGEGVMFLHVEDLAA